MADIKAIKIDEVYTRIECDPHIREELSQYFTFKIPDHHFNPMVKKKLWDGLIRLFNKRNNCLYSGLLKYLNIFAQERNYKVEYDPELILMNSFSLTEASDFIKALNTEIEPRDYQVTAIAKAIRYKRMMMLSPTSSGKSFIIYCIIRYLLDNGLCKRGIVIVPTTSLVEQMSGDFASYSKANEWDTATYVQRMYEGHSKALNLPSKVVISTWQSIFRFKEEGFFDQFDFIIGDEAHTFKANSLAEIMKKLTKAKYRIGTTGTLDDTKVHRLSLEGYFGPVSKITTSRKLMDDGHIAELHIKSLVLKHPKGTQALINDVIEKSTKANPYWTAEGKEAQLAFQAEMDYLIDHTARNKFLRNLAVSIEGNSLLLFQYVERHGKVLYDLISEKLSGTGRKVFFVHGGVDTADREQVRAITEKEKNAIIVASYGVFSTGINIRNLHNVIFASPTKSKIRVLQSIGRGLRLGDDKSTATLYDIADDFREKPTDKANYTLKHYANRMIIYYKEKFKVSHYDIDLK